MHMFKDETFMTVAKNRTFLGIDMHNEQDVAE